MSQRDGWDQQWDDGWGETTGLAPNPAGGWADEEHGHAGGHRRSSSGRGAGFWALAIVVGVVIAGLLALVGYLLLGRESAPVGEATGVPAPVAERQAPSPSTSATQVGASSTAPVAGTYTGVLRQRGTTGGQRDQDFPVEMTFSASGSTVNYPSLGCRGTLTPTGDADGARVYLETITAGGCEPTGTWNVTRGSDSAVAAEYRPAIGSHLVTGQLTR